MPELNIRIRPIQGESLQGYLLRLITSNGWSSIHSMFSAIGIPSKGTDIYMFPTYTQLEFLAHTIAPWIRMEPSKFFNHFEDQTNIPYLYRQKRAISNISLKQPRMCLDCFHDKNTRFFRSEWSMLPYSYCKSHKTELLEACPSCRAPFLWERSIFSHCNKCGAKWKDLHSPKNFIQDCWQTDFEAVKNNDEEILDWFDNFCTWLVKSGRPYDHMHKKIEQLPATLKGINELMKQAYMLKSSIAPTELKLYEWPAKGLVEPKRLKALDSIHHHISFETVGELLNIPSNSVAFLVSNNFFHSILDHSSVRDMFFDKRVVDNWLESIPINQPETQSKFIQLDQNHPLLRLHGVRYGEVIAFGLKRKLLTRGPNAFESIYIPTTSIKSLLTELMQEVIGTQLVSKNRVQRMLMRGQSTLKELVKGGDIKLSKDSDSSNLIIGQSVVQLISKGHPHLTKRSKVIQQYF